MLHKMYNLHKMKMSQCKDSSYRVSNPVPDLSESGAFCDVGHVPLQLAVAQ